MENVTLGFINIYVVIISDADILSEFLESFYIKYGSFIPLSQADVLEYLKKNGNSDLSHRFFQNTHLQADTHSRCAESVLHTLDEREQTSDFHCKSQHV